MNYHAQNQLKKNTTLLLVSFILAISIAARIESRWTIIQPAIANNISSAERAEMSSENTIGTSGFMELLKQLKSRKQDLDEREKYIRLQEAKIKLAESELKRQIEKLNKIEDELRSTIETASEAAVDDIMQLVTVYQQMKPKDAALMFAEMEPDFAAGFLSRMAPENVAPIMENLPPALSYSISVEIAGRNAQIRTGPLETIK